MSEVIKFPRKTDMKRPGDVLSRYEIEEDEFDAACGLIHVVFRINDFGQEMPVSRRQVGVYPNRESAEFHKLDLEAILYGALRDTERARLERERGEQLPDDNGPEAA